MKRGRPRKMDVVSVRDPEPVNRDPVTVRDWKPRMYIPAPMPVACPDCGGGTRMADGRHVDVVRRKVLEYRTCAKCGAKLAAGRDMTESEKNELCGFEEAVREYEQSAQRN